MKKHNPEEKLLKTIYVPKYHKEDSKRAKNDQKLNQFIRYIQ